MRATVVGLISILLLSAAPAYADTEPRGISCDMTGTVEVKPGLRAPAPGYTGGTYKVKITGELTGCQGTGSTVESGTFRANARGEGTCVSRQVEGPTKVRWDNGNVTTFYFNSNDVASANAFNTIVEKSTEPAMSEGDEGIGVLRFEADTAKCNTPEGVTSARFTGRLTSGASS